MCYLSQAILDMYEIYLEAQNVWWIILLVYRLFSFLGFANHIADLLSEFVSAGKAFP